MNTIALALGVSLAAMLVAYPVYLSRASAQSSAAAPIEVMIHGGAYVPARVSTRAGVPTRIRFVRHDSSPCTAEVVFPSLGLRRAIPAHGSVTLDLPALRPGEYPFECGMGMVRGTLIVEST